MKQIPQNIIKEIKETFSSSKKIVIISHHNPDGDAIGSVLGLYIFLKKKSFEVNVISPNDYPKFFLQYSRSIT